MLLLFNDYEVKANAMSHHILITVDALAHPDPGLEQAIDRAHTQRADLTTFTLIPPPPVLASLGDAVAMPLAGELRAEFATHVPSAIETNSHDNSVQTVLTGKPGREALIEQWETARIDLPVPRTTALATFDHPAQAATGQRATS